jgi:hypothetical protein
MDGTFPSLGLWRFSCKCSHAWCMINTLKHILHMFGNISSTNQSVCANRVNSHMDHRINIQGGAQAKWEGDLQKFDYPIQKRAVNCKITQSSCFLDVDLVAQIGVCTKRLVCTWYVPHMFCSNLCNLKCIWICIYLGCRQTDRQRAGKENLPDQH